MLQKQSIDIMLNLTMNNQGEVSILTEIITAP